jgi:pimeloyl-ACP methyl ester carboxylesterase
MDVLSRGERRPRTLAVVVRAAVPAVVIVVCAVLFALAPAASAQMSLQNPPPSANDFSCKPSASHPDPVVLVHGLGATMGENWGFISPKLAAQGYCVFALTYGLDPRFPYFGGVLPIEKSAPELASFVNTVLADTGASKVDLVGHSEGTFMPEYWLKYLGGASKVDKYVAMTPLYQGTDLGSVAQLRDAGAQYGLAAPILNLVDQFCGSCTEFLAGSDMVKQLNANGGPEVPGIQYTTIMTEHDELVVPYTSGMLPPPATNIVLQQVCPTDLDEHALEAFDPVVVQLIENALDPAHAQPVKCGLLPPLL